MKREELFERLTEEFIQFEENQGKGYFKECTVCGERYQSVRDFFERTSRCSSGNRVLEDLGSTRIMVFHGDCNGTRGDGTSCGSTLGVFSKLSSGESKYIIDLAKSQGVDIEDRDKRRDFFEGLLMEYRLHLHGKDSA